MQPKALDTIDDLMGRAEFPTVQYQAARSVIEWTEGKATERVNATVDADVRITWQS